MPLCMRNAIRLLRRGATRLVTVRGRGRGRGRVKVRVKVRVRVRVRGAR